MYTIASCLVLLLRISLVQLQIIVTLSLIYLKFYQFFIPTLHKKLLNVLILLSYQCLIISTLFFSLLFQVLISRETGSWYVFVVDIA